ncbi:MAG: DUF2497 domain-containing protein [Alphaproteobacteria bacterium]|nr:DUF2497 domain-containing protein [Alphaproteobacteria bacterium]
MTNNPVEPTDESIEDILSSIRETVEEETSKDEDDMDPEALAEQMLSEQVDESVPDEPASDHGDIDESLMSSTEVNAPSKKEAAGSFEADMHPVEEDEVGGDEELDVDALVAETAPAAEEGSAEEGSDADEDDVLDLLDEVETDTDDDFVDVEHFEETGESKPAQSSHVEEAQESYKADSAAEEEDVSGVLDELGAETVVEEVSDEAVLAAFKGAAASGAATSAEYKHLNALPGAEGLQVGFPMEVLAEALRPLVKGWIQNNLPDIVERLVKEELEKLADK